jgi:hypothetical protein
VEFSLWPLDFVSLNFQDLPPAVSLPLKFLEMLGSDAAALFVYPMQMLYHCCHCPLPVLEKAHHF